MGPEDTNEQFPMTTAEAERIARANLIENLFTYHPPTEEQKAFYARINLAAKQFAMVVLECTPPGGDQGAAIRKIREARMTANAAIACHGANYPLR